MTKVLTATKCDHEITDTEVMDRRNGMDTYLAIVCQDCGSVIGEVDGDN